VSGLRPLRFSQTKPSPYGLGYLNIGALRLMKRSREGRASLGMTQSEEQSHERDDRAKSGGGKASSVPSPGVASHSG